MKTLLFIFLAGYSVRCDDSNSHQDLLSGMVTTLSDWTSSISNLITTGQDVFNQLVTGDKSSYYVVQRPEDPPTFKVYWNVPTMQCKSKKIPFTNLYENFGIIQNDQDSFRGEKISIMYDPGLFPALLKNESSGQFKYRNGGVPQEGDLMKHLEVFKSEMEQSIPDENFDGVGIIDFESWRPVFRQNFGILTPYKDVSYEIEKQNHWWWKKAWIQAEAKRRFEESARAFMQTTLATAKKMRPRAQWGYYGFPYCFNIASNNMNEECADKVPKENDGTYWLWSESTTLYPSVYSPEELSSSQLASLIRGRVAEAKRVGRSNTPILPYFWFRYRNGGYFREKDLNTALSTLHKSNASGFIIWGSSNDVNTVEKCNKLLTYVNEVLGPAVAKYTKHKILQDDYEDVSTTVTPINTASYDPEFDWIPPKNYTENIQQMVDEELADKNETRTELEGDSMLIDIILHSIANYCVDDHCDSRKDNSTKVTTEGVNSTEVSIEVYTEVNTEVSTEGITKVNTEVSTDVSTEVSTEVSIEVSTEVSTEMVNMNESRIVLVTDDPFRLNKTDGVDATESTTSETHIENTTGDYIEELLFEGELENSTEIVIEDYIFENITESTNPEMTTENYSTTETNSNEDVLNLNIKDLVNVNADVVHTDTLNSNDTLYSNYKNVVNSKEVNIDMSSDSNYTKVLSLYSDIIVNTNYTDVLNSNYTDLLNANDTDVLNSNDIDVLNSNDTDVLNSNYTDVLNSNDIDVLNSTTLAPILTNQVIVSVI